jgi:hypothetical protein
VRLFPATAASNHERKDFRSVPAYLRVQTEVLENDRRDNSQIWQITSSLVEETIQYQKRAEFRLLDGSREDLFRSWQTLMKFADATVSSCFGVKLDAVACWKVDD